MGSGPNSSMPSSTLASERDRLMRIVLFCHSLISDWNHGNAHFLRGVVTELLSRGHAVTTYEPRDGWSLTQLRQEQGDAAIARFHQTFPMLHPQVVDLSTLALDEALDGADLVLVHEWMPHAFVERVGRHRVGGGRYTLLFHDTHHRSVTDPDAMAQYRLDCYDGVLAFGDVIRERYVSLGWNRRAWTWHEAADVRTFAPRPSGGPQRDLVWIGNWGDDERNRELRAYLFAPVRALGLSATVHGVRYPSAALGELAAAGITYAGWIANADAPDAYARHRITVHVPRRPYVESLPGVPTIRVFEALACGMPLVSVGWRDEEGLFSPGADYLVADTPAAMASTLRVLRGDEAMRHEIAKSGLETIHRRHTCAHRVDELLAITAQLRPAASREAVAS
jgi:spore maturation protein CgeB